MADAVISWASKDEAVARSLEKTERGFDAILRKLNDVERASKKTAEATSTGFDSGLAKIDQFARGFAGVGAVVSGVRVAAELLKQEYDQLVQRQNRALDANKSLAEVLPGTFRQFGGLLTGKEVTASVSQVSKATGVDQVKVAQAIGEAAAARGATNKQEAQEAISAAQAALKFAPEADPQTIAALAGGTTDLQRRFHVSAEQSIGYLARVGGQARVTSLREQVQNINPAIGALAQFGMSPQAAGGLVSSLTGASGDFTGAMSRTASIQLAKQLEDRGYATPEAGIAAMQADPKLRESFFKGGKFGKKSFSGASFEAAQYPFIRELLTGGSGLAKNYADATREVGTFAQGGETYNQMIEQIGELTPVGIAAGERKGEAATERFQVGRSRDARTAAVRKRLEEAFGEVDSFGPQAFTRYAAIGTFDKALYGNNLDPEIAGSKLLQNFANNAQRDKTLTSDEISYLREQAGILRQMLEELRKSNTDAPEVKNRPAQALGR